MAPSFQDPARYASLHVSPSGEGDARPTALQIAKDNDVVGKMKDKTFFVTGGSNGLGVDIVRTLAKTGGRVFFTARDLAKGQRVRDEILREAETDELLKGAEIEVLEMEQKKLSSVKAAVKEFKKKSNSLNVLVCNAGIANTPHGLTDDGFEQQFGVNHLSHFYLFQLLKQVLLASSTPSFHSRVISVSSAVHTLNSVLVGDYNLEKRGYDPVVSYASAKTANIWFANEIERRYGSQGLHALSVHPGGINTGLPRFFDPSVAAFMQPFLDMPHVQNAFKSVEQGAASIVLAAVGKDYEGVGGMYMEDCAVSPPMPEDALPGVPGYKPWAYDEDGERKLWIDSLEMVGLADG